MLIWGGKGVCLVFVGWFGFVWFFAFFFKSKHCHILSEAYNIAHFSDF